MDQKKPHDETWANDDESPGWGEIRLVSTPEDVGEGDPESIWIGEFNTPERRRLAAQAPAMARLLLQVNARECPVCGDAKFPTAPHRDGCEFAAVLRAAGVLP